MIHCYKLGGLNIVLDVYSGSVHLVDEIAYDMIERYETTPKDALLDELFAVYGGREDVSMQELSALWDEIAALKDAGKLFAEDTFAPLAGTLKERSQGIVKALCLHVAHSCNLNCSYCFASQGKYHGDRALMSF